MDAVELGVILIFNTNI